MVTIQNTDLKQLQLLNISSDNKRVNQDVISDAVSAFAAFLSLSSLF